MLEGFNLPSAVGGFHDFRLSCQEYELQPASEARFSLLANTRTMPVNWYRYLLWTRKSCLQNANATLLDLADCSRIQEDVDPVGYDSDIPVALATLTRFCVGSGVANCSNKGKGINFTVRSGGILHRRREGSNSRLHIYICTPSTLMPHLPSSFRSSRCPEIRPQPVFARLSTRFTWLSDPYVFVVTSYLCACFSASELQHSLCKCTP